MSSCTPLPSATKPVLANQLTPLPCLVVYVKFYFEYTTAKTYLLTPSFRDPYTSVVPLSTLEKGLLTLPVRTLPLLFAKKLVAAKP